MNTTILITTANADSDMYRECRNSIIENTRAGTYEILTSDNRHIPNFAHAKTINRALRYAHDSDYFVTLDDDVTVYPEWLECQQDYMSDYCAFVGTCSVYRDSATLWSRGLCFDKFGRPINYRDHPDRVEFVPCACSCLMVIGDKRARNRVHFDQTHYRKYYFDAAFCLAQWANGRKVITIPTPVYHLGAATQRFSKTPAMVELDRESFRFNWLESALLKEMRNGATAKQWAFDVLRG